LRTSLFFSEQRISSAIGEKTNKGVCSYYSLTTNYNQMKPVRLALFVVLFIFHIIVVFISLRFTQSMADGIVRDPGAFRFLALFGLGIFLVTFAFVWLDRYTARKKIERLEVEKDRIKAEVFDREQRARERELEIEREISSFQQSLPGAASSAARDSTAPHSWKPKSAASTSELPPAAPSEPSETDQVEYAPLTPKLPDTSSDSPPADDTDTNSPRS
jgi:hypothetical protein